jgi:hypothetical protein
MKRGLMQHRTADSSDSLDLPEVSARAGLEMKSGKFYQKFVEWRRQQ